MRHKPTRIAAVIALAVLLAGMFGLGGGSVAFSQVGHAVGSTLVRLKEMIMEIRTGEIMDRAPSPPAASANADEQAPASNLRAVMCTARYFKISENEQAVWQSLKDQGIGLIQASATPETYYATLDQEQVGQFEDALTVEAIASPRVMVWEGHEAMIGSGAFALAWLPTISSDGTRIESTFSFHDGENGFEVPNVSTEEGGGVLVRVRGTIPAGEDILILLKVGIP